MLTLQSIVALSKDLSLKHLHFTIGFFCSVPQREHPVAKVRKSTYKSLVRGRVETLTFFSLWGPTVSQDFSWWSRVLAVCGGEGQAACPWPLISGLSDTLKGSVIFSIGCLEEARVYENEAQY